MARRFARKQRIALFLRENGACSGCGARLSKGWHADHRTPYSRNGASDAVNGAALCPQCNLEKGSKAMNFSNRNKKTEAGGQICPPASACASGSAKPCAASPPFGR